MSALYYQPISRKEFLRVSAGVLGSLLVSVGKQPVWGEDAAAEAHACPLRLAMLSDTHIAADPAEEYRGFRPLENLQRVVGEVLIAQPDAMILNGDAARLEGQIADYERLQELLQPIAERLPIGIGLGNHDDRQNFRQVLGATASPFRLQEGVEKHVLVMEHPWVRLIMLDSLLYVNQVAGLLGLSQRKWLSRFLAESDARPTVLIVHHTLGEADGELLDADRLFRILEPHPQVKAIFYGHSHRYQIETRDRLHLVNLPACGYNFADDQPVGWVDAHFHATGCEMTLRAIDGNQQDGGKSVELMWKT